MQDKPRLKRTGEKPNVGIVHLGPGAFFRAFSAVYTHEAMDTSGGDWGIVAVSLRSPTARDQLVPQGGVYTSVTLKSEGADAHVIGSICDVLVAPENPSAVIDAMTDDAVRIVSLTITEKGYCYQPATGRLNLAHPDIVHDQQNLDDPKSAIGFIVSALAKRREMGLKPFTVMSCDNLPSNGELVRKMVLEFARNLDYDLAEWIGNEVTFPSTMVDRITPASTDSDIERLAEMTGYYDPASVAHENFRQWVIEDKFVDGRPDWDQVGAQFVDDVDAHETMKLRCLNGTHSTLAYLGYLAGYETISQSVADENYARFCEHLWQNEIVPTVPQPEGEDLAAYCASLLARYQDTAIRHKTWQIAMDGSQKLPQRILGTIRDNLEKGHLPRGLCLTVAAWMRYVGGVDEKGEAIDVRDPFAAELKQLSDTAGTAEEKVRALLRFEAVFGTDLSQKADFCEAVEKAYLALVEKGAKETVREFVAV